MKFSLNFLKDYNQHKNTLAGDIAAIGTNKLIEKIGSQLGAIDEVIRLGGLYDGAVVVKVVSCEKHPDADKLSLCTIYNGKEKVQVVCGAPNVREGMLAVWLPPGATVPETADKEPFVLEAREIRGQVSNGMLASYKELALGDSHAGILELDEEAKPGTAFAEAYNLKDDIVLDIENKMFTHRPDCFGWLGIDRELAGIQHLAFKSPDWYHVDPKLPQPQTEVLPITITNELPDSVQRFAMLPMSGITVGPSPVWLQIELAKIGQKSINNVVDITNYVMLLTGQPTHAYDYDKVKALSNDEAAIVVRNPKPGEKIKLLNGREIEPRPAAIMIATDKQSIGLGGVMGGSETEVDDDTNNILLEVANFDMYDTRRTMMEHGIFTDAGTRFNKGQSPLQNLAVLAKLAELITKDAGGKVAGKVIDDNHVNKGVLDRGSLYPPVKVAADFINSRLGLQLSPAEIKKLLENVEFSVETKGSELTVVAPFWRTDIELREDVVEEVGRLYGYDRLPLVLPERDLAPTRRDPLLDLKVAIRERLSKAGASEVLTYSFVHGDLLDKTGQDKKRAFEIANALSPDLQYYRMSLMPSLLEKVHPNIKAGYDEFALFELGKTHSLDHKTDDDGLPEEFEFTALVVAANDKLKKQGAPYYQARKYLETLTGAELSFKPVGEDMQKYAVVRPYRPERSALVSVKGGEFLGIIGEFKPSVARALKLPTYTAGFEIDTKELAALYGRNGYRPLSRFPAVRQDITLKTDVSVTFEELNDFLAKELAGQAPEDSQAKLYPISVYQKADDTNYKQVTFRAEITATNRTLTDKEVAAVLDSIADAAKSKLKAERV